MIDIINIVIKDDDAFFVEGLKSILTEYFYQQRKQVDFIAADDGIRRVDLVFAASPLTRKTCHCARISLATHQNTRFFTIRSREHRSLALISRCEGETGTLYRKQAAKAVYHLLDMPPDPALNKKRGRCRTCSGISLTRREKEVLAHLRNGTSQTETAEQMHLSVKTINAHKQSVMKKLDLKKKHDFIHWLMRV